MNLTAPGSTNSALTVDCSVSIANNMNARLVVFLGLPTISADTVVFVVATVSASLVRIEEAFHQ